MRLLALLIPAFLTACTSKNQNYSCENPSFKAPLSLSIEMNRSATLGTMRYEFCKQNGNVSTFSIKHPEYTCSGTEWQLLLVFDPITGVLHDVSKTPTTYDVDTYRCTKVD